MFHARWFHAGQLSEQPHITPVYIASDISVDDIISLISLVAQLVPMMQAGAHVQGFSNFSPFMDFSSYFRLWAITSNLSRFFFELGMMSMKEGHKIVMQLCKAQDTSAPISSSKEEVQKAFPIKRYFIVYSQVCFENKY